MPLVTSKKMLLEAQAGHYAVPAFNVENMEMAQAVIRAAADMNSPIIIQTTPSTLRYGGVRVYAAMIGALAANERVSVALHLDHGESYVMCVQAVSAGYTSIMIDGSKLAFTYNAAITAKVAEMASALDLPVEGELGAVGGKEDDTVSAESAYTDPDEAADFVRRTGVFSLAIGIGTAHGIYSGVPKPDIERVSAVARKVNIPLVLHGTSGVAADDVRECVRRGICKVNYATDLRVAFTQGVRETLMAEADVFDPKVYLNAGREKVYETVKAGIMLCGSREKA